MNERCAIEVYRSLSFVPEDRGRLLEPAVADQRARDVVADQDGTEVFDPLLLGEGRRRLVRPPRPLRRARRGRGARRSR